MKLNPRPHSEKGRKKPAERLAGGQGAWADTSDAYENLRRIAVTWFLFEEPFYGKAEDIYALLKKWCGEVEGEQLAALAVECREMFNLRRMPLFLARELARHYQGSMVSDTIANVIRRPDEITDFLALYWKDGNDQPLSKQVKLGLAAAFKKFDEYQLAKYDRAGEIKLRDVLFLVHAEPEDAPGRKNTRKERKAEREQDKNIKGKSLGEKLFEALVNRTLSIPDTWEVALSKGDNKRRVFERLMEENKLGDDAFLRNIRGMSEAGITLATLREELGHRNFKRQLPTQFLAAAKEVPALEEEIIEALLRKVGQTKIGGKTCVIIDVSGSMNQGLSNKSDMRRVDAAIALAMILRESCESCVIYATAGDDGAKQHETAIIPKRRGMALRDALLETFTQERSNKKFLGGGGIFVVQVMSYVAEQEEGTKFDRVVILTDEQDTDIKSNTVDKAKRLGQYNYILNVAPEKFGVVTGGKWTRISGFTEHVVDFLLLNESTGLFRSDQNQ